VGHGSRRSDARDHQIHCRSCSATPARRPLMAR
jgi:hypothetical protein